MNILVCISSVPDTTSKINFTADGKAFDKNGIQFVINPYDEFSLTRAIWFQEKQGATVTVLTVGDASVEPVMRKALAIGANDAIRVDTEPHDSYSTAKEIAKVIAENQYDLILMGRESIDYNGNAVPAMLAAELGWSFVNNCIGLEVEEDQATAVSEIDGGKETVKFKLPAIIAGQKGIVEEKDLKIPNMRGIMQARSKPLNVVEASGAEAQVKADEFEKPEPRSSVTLVDKDNVEELVRLLHEEAKVI
ncbi:electron transfer flavoprotein beta subunit/FixA family protein [Flavobacteriaceae bacterium Ap0902]|nr:electron transfer flavoprotein beta subunit/FixA family protein [Flavobacteriaceae bacterium Ap0902]